MVMCLEIYNIVNRPEFLEEVSILTQQEWGSHKSQDEFFDKVYLKSELKNYYEKFGAKYIEDLSNGKKLYYIDLKS